MKLLLITDAWFPQINGVVRTLNTVKEALEAQGDQVDVISPSDFKTIPCPTYPEIRLALFPKGKIRKAIEDGAYDAIHIATEGPLGHAGRGVCKKLRLAFTTAYHTKFPEYVHVRTGIPLKWSYGVMRWFHGASAGVMVATPTLKNELAAQGIGNLCQWSRGVDLSLFKPYGRDSVPALNDLPRPILTYVGRVAVEKNIEAYLELKTEGTKLVVGDGPQLASLKKKFPDAVFVGAKSGVELAQHYAASDVFVFPSKTDTFGLVMLEALACGVPVAAYPVPGPLDVVALSGKGVLRRYDQPIGHLSNDLSNAVEKALTADVEACREYALNFSWEKCAALFKSHLVHPVSGLALDVAAPESIAAQ